MFGNSNRGGRGRCGGDIPFRTSRGGGQGAGQSGQGARGSGGGGGRGRGGSAHGGNAGQNTTSKVFAHSPGPPARFDPAVKKIEDETAITLVSTKNQARLPFRPGYGTRGTEVLLWANYFKVSADREIPLHRYSIEVRPDNDGKVLTGKKLRRVIELLLEEHFAEHRSNIATDFKLYLISTTNIAISRPVYDITYREGGQVQTQSNAKHYHVRITHNGSVTLANLLDYLTSSNASAILSNREALLQALNIIVGYTPKTAAPVSSLGMKHFDTTSPEKKSLDVRLAALRGFFCSIRAATGGLLVNVQVKHTAFYNGGNLAQAIASFTKQTTNMFELARFLRKLSVTATHVTPPKVKTISGLAIVQDGMNLPHPPRVPKFGASAQEVMFWLPRESAGVTSGSPSAGRYISVHDFFKETYNRILKYKLPVVNVGTTGNPIYLPAEVCEIIPGQPFRGILSDKQLQEMNSFAIRSPKENALSITTGGAQLLGFGIPNCPTLQAFKIRVTPHLVAVPGRILNAPPVKYSQGRQQVARYGSWNLVNVHFANASRLPTWTYCWIKWRSSNGGYWRDTQQLQTTLTAFTTALRSVGIQCTEPVDGQVAEVDSNNLDAIDTTLARFTRPSTRGIPGLVLVILPSKHTEIYNRVKYACDIKEGLVNVCIVAEQLAKKSRQTLANVALKVNLKLGGRNHELDSSKLGVLSEGKTMVVGLDVTHPSPGSAPDAPSVVGIVASVDELLGQWPAQLAVQQGRKEMVSELKGLMKSRLCLWRDHNKGELPSQILLYRDGVSEGQYHQVLELELPQIRAACSEIYPANQFERGTPRITIIVVGKRHHTRFYPTTESQCDRTGNPQNGTVVDRGVTEARNWDFFMQAHTAIKGTARPAHYFVAYDEIFQDRAVQKPLKNAADCVEDLTHNMCYLFGRATKAVSICPPAYYSDLVCDRARKYLYDYYVPSARSTNANAAAAAGAGAGGSRLSMQDRVSIHERVENTMFYI
ncbi:hypothetical protein A1O1_01209 [Capronia coronata CBS 617.96]|uniref:Piwi domain-containing protein n=1 Tax=Capronia coronata CBS 617.96 TaxID=1182541 RepID=W9YU89_9EURO|nr:uncharacterized protein A1O1_01209 [Capronia coronata CBS 617.96]EXJ96083.1 hypothetical protein A1O1_01209 [Capronia coronata CBS 617.96]